MRRSTRPGLVPLLLGAGVLLAGCATRVPPSAVAWNDRGSVLGPTTGGLGAGGAVGYLRVETDTDLRVIGRETYYNLRRPYDLYDDAGNLLQASIDNQDGRTGEEPVLRPLAPGRYVIASVYGTTYRKVQVEIRAGARTEVSAQVLSEAPPVFAAD